MKESVALVFTQSTALISVFVLFWISSLTTFQVVVGVFSIDTVAVGSVFHIVFLTVLFTVLVSLVFTQSTDHVDVVVVVVEPVDSTVVVHVLVFVVTFDSVVVIVQVFVFTVTGGVSIGCGLLPHDQSVFDGV